MTIADKLTSISTTKQSIKEAIEAKSVTVGSIPFSQYANKISEITGSGGDPLPPDWVRPSDWLPLPEVLPTEQKIVGLFPVFDNDSNAVAFYFGGAYTVDWGDGTIENFASGNTASHIYSYANISDTTLSSRGYKQVIITITPQAGNDLTVVDFNQVATGNANAAGYNGAYRIHSWLELIISVPKLFNQLSLTISNSLNAFWPYCESVKIISWPSVGINCYSLFPNFYSLQNVTPFKLSGATNTAYMFQNCKSLRKLVGFDFSQAGVSTGTMTNMFNGCINLEVISDTFNGPAITGDKMQFMFQNCNSLLEIPKSLDGAAPTNLISTFAGCSKIKNIPNLNYSNVTNASSTFQNCDSLEFVNLSLPACTTIATIFSACDKLKEVNLTTSSALTVMNNSFQNCVSLTKIGVFNTASVTNVSTAFSGATGLNAIPAFNFSAVTNIGSVTGSNYNLARIDATDIKQTVSFANCRLSATELNRIFTNLPVVTGKTITVTGNYGAATCDTTIATSKGWVVSR